VRELSRELGRRGVGVDIFTRSQDRAAPTIVALDRGVRVINLHAGPSAPYDKNWVLTYLPEFVSRVRCFADGQDLAYDLIHSHYWLSGVAATRLACHWDIPHVTMFHTLGRLKQLANPKEPEPALRLEMEQRLIHHVDRIIASTVDERQQMVRHCGASASRVTVIPCGVDLKLFVPHARRLARERLGLPAERPILLFAGRLDPFKGPDLLLRATSLMQQDALVVIVGGKGSDAKQLKIEERVFLLGSHPREKMPLFYSAANVTVVPSYHETFGLAAVESLACGTPVVATRAGGLTTVVHHGENGFLVARCPGFFAERLDALLSDNQLATRLSTAARPSVVQFSWEKVAQQVFALYHELTTEGISLIAQ
jgi:D-inositol-3-phosphate glycosyltransferase